jgi:hypothetical protein
MNLGARSVSVLGAHLCSISAVDSLDSINSLAIVRKHRMQIESKVPSRFERWRKDGKWPDIYMNPLGEEPQAIKTPFGRSVFHPTKLKTKLGHYPVACVGYAALFSQF